MVGMRSNSIIRRRLCTRDGRKACRVMPLSGFAIYRLVLAE